METNTNHHHSPSKPEEMQISASSSPAHEFSFNISLQSSSTPTHNNSNHQHSSSSSAIDLTPADEIFFHGHLLPLHLLHNIPSISPRASTHSLDGSELLPARETHSKIDGCSYTIGHSFNSYEYTTRATTMTSDEFPTKVRTKAKSFSLFGLARRRKEEEEDKGNKKKARFDMGHFVKRYMKIFSKGRADEEIHFRKQPYSFSGKMSSREGRRDLRGEFSAPASMRTSPSDSGILSAKSSNSPPSNDSSMEELQAAIQAAIAHCKDSIVAPGKLKG